MVPGAANLNLADSRTDTALGQNCHGKTMPLHMVCVPNPVGGYFRSQQEPEEMHEFQEIMATIEKGIDEARRNPKADEPIPADDYIAWCIVNTLRQAGFRIVRRSKGFSYSQPDS
jgi:hypothetical protein